MKNIRLETTEFLTLEELVDKVSNTLPEDDIPKFIALLEESKEDWELTINLIRHFKALEEIAKKEVFEDEEVDWSPKRILP